MPINRGISFLSLSSPAQAACSRTADVAAAHAQPATYLRDFPLAFRSTAFTVASDDLFAKYGTPFTPLNHFSPWNVDDDRRPVELDESWSSRKAGMFTASHICAAWDAVRARSDALVTS